MDENHNLVTGKHQIRPAGQASPIQTVAQAETMQHFAQCYFWASVTPLNPGHCSGLMKPDTHLGENARQIEVSDDQTTPLLYS